MDLKNIVIIKETNLLVGKRVIYSLSEGGGTKLIQGYVLDKILMVQKEGDPCVTGYLVLNLENNKIFPIAYWRIKSTELGEGLQQLKLTNEEEEINYNKL